MLKETANGNRENSNQKCWLVLEPAYSKIQKFQNANTALDKLQLEELVLALQFLRDTFDADIFSEVAEARAATRDFLHVGFGEPAPLPV